MRREPQPPPRVHDLVHQLAERESRDDGGLPFHRVVVSIRLGLESLLGPSGADAMVYRAIFLTRRELGLVSDVRDAQGLRQRERFTEQEGPEAAEFTKKVVAHLIWMIIEFIGEDLTLSFIRQIWPDVVYPRPAAEKES